jgi:hypothetical protein
METLSTGTVLKEAYATAKRGFRLLVVTDLMLAALIFMPILVLIVLAALSSLLGTQLGALTLIIRIILVISGLGTLIGSMFASAAMAIVPVLVLADSTGTLTPRQLIPLSIKKVWSYWTAAFASGLISVLLVLTIAVPYAVLSLLHAPVALSVGVTALYGIGVYFMVFYWNWLWQYANIVAGMKNTHAFSLSMNMMNAQRGKTMNIFIVSTLFVAFLSGIIYSISSFVYGIFGIPLSAMSRTASKLPDLTKTLTPAAIIAFFVVGLVTAALNIFLNFYACAIQYEVYKLKLAAAQYSTAMTKQFKIFLIVSTIVSIVAVPLLIMQGGH